MAHTAYKLLQWIKFKEKRYFIKFTVLISNFKFVQFYSIATYYFMGFLIFGQVLMSSV